MTLAEYFIILRADDSHVKDVIDRTEERIGAFATKVSGIAQRFFIYRALELTTRAFQGLASGLSDSIMKAASLGETFNKVDVTFGESAQQVKDFADDMSKRFGLVRNDTLGAAAGFGQILKASGLTGDAAADLSIKLVHLATGISSLHDIPLDVALEKVRAGLVGEAEPLRTVGILLSENAVKAEAAASGAADHANKLSEAEKIQARFAIMMRQGADAYDDLERTSTSAKNATRNFQGQLAEIQTTIGEGLMPVMEAVMPVVSELAGQFATWVTAHQDDLRELAQSIGTFLVGALEKAASAVERLQGYFQNLVKLGPQLQQVWDHFTHPLGMNLPGIGGSNRGMPGLVPGTTQTGNELVDALLPSFGFARDMWNQTDPNTDIEATNKLREFQQPHHQAVGGVFGGAVPFESSRGEEEMLRAQLQRAREDLESARYAKELEKTLAEHGRDAALAVRGIYNQVSYNLLQWGRGAETGLAKFAGRQAEMLFGTGKTEAFQSQMTDASSIASDVARASLSKDKDDTKLAERTAKATEATVDYLKDVAGGIKDALANALTPKFQ